MSTFRRLCFGVAIFLLLIYCADKSFACSCSAPPPACALVSRGEVVFLGTPVFTDDDGSGTFVQRTLYRFKVDEIYKGLPRDAREVWIDPGSYTSCYADYKLGKQYLMFATKANYGPVVAMTVSKRGAKQKRLPPGFDRKSPSPVYLAPECSGSGPAKAATDDIEFLRAWVKGATRTRLYGTVKETYADAGAEGGRGLPKTTVRVTGSGYDRTVTSDDSGLWNLDDIKPGNYTVTAASTNYQLWRPREIEVAARACGYADLLLKTNGRIGGAVVDANGKPVQGVKMHIARLMSDGDVEDFYVSKASTSKAGIFAFDGLPSGEYVVGVNLHDTPSVSTPYLTTYAPGVTNRNQAQVVHLQPGGSQTNLLLRLPPPIPTRTVRVRVIWPNGRPAAKVDVWANVGKATAVESGETDSRGIVELKCLSELDYTLTGFKWITTSPDVPNKDARRADTKPVRVAAGKGTAAARLVLSEIKAGKHLYE